STRLSDVAAVVVTDDYDPTVRMQQLFKAMGQETFDKVAPILEINPSDPFVKKIADSSDDSFVSDASSILLDQALIAEGVLPEDPADFAAKLHRILAQ
ncbi:MAG: molecular chaperone HtpG, partial [Spirochaetales bacterium]